MRRDCAVLLGADNTFEPVGFRVVREVLPRNFAEHAPLPPVKKKPK
jgi:hypothetical protein